jgi:hypothetical protein
MMMGRSRLVGVLAGVAASVLALTSVPQVAAADPGFTIGDRHVTDPAGMSADQEHNRYWAVAGGSGAVRAWAVDGSGVPLGPAAAQNQAQSVQGTAYRSGNLYLGDVGGLRSNVTFWRLRAPVPTTTVREARAYRLRYPDGSHRSKAIMVDSRGLFYVVTNDSSGAIYRTPKRPSHEEVTVMARVADAPSNVVDAVSLPHGGAAMRSPEKLYLLDDKWKVVATESIPNQPQGGALALSLDKKSVIAAAGSGGSTEVFPLPEQFKPNRPAPKPVATEEEPEPDEREQGEAEPTVIRQTGTAVTVAAAMGIAVLAGLVVLFRR